MLISKFDNTNIEVLIKEFEEKYNFNFPKQYLSFLLKYNGGETPDTDFRIKGVSSDLRALYGFGNADKYYNYKDYGDDHIEKFIIDDMLPIGSNDCGDYILLGIGKDNNGKIYFLYHDMPKKYKELTPDFISFVDKCRSKKIGHIRTIEERRQGMIDNGMGDEITPISLEGWQAEIDEYANMHQEKLILEVLEEEPPTLVETYKQGIPAYPKLEQVVPLPFHEKTNQFIVDYKALSDKEFWQKYELDGWWVELEKYIEANKKHETFGIILVNALVKFGYLLPVECKEVNDYKMENFWGDEPVKLVTFDTGGGYFYYYAYIPESVELASIFDIIIKTVE